MDPFLEAVQQILKLKSSPTNEEKGKLYGLYKQATVGNVTGTQPYFYDVIARGKWDSWNSNKSKTADQAKKEYVEFVALLITKYGLADPVVVA